MDVSPWPGLALRPFSAGDLPLLKEIYASTREEEISVTGWLPAQKEAFLLQQFNAQHQWYQTHYQGGAFDLIVEHGQTVGRLYVYRQPGNLNVIDIALLPAHRSRGLGTFLMRQLLAEAVHAGQTVTLHVEFFNRARTLYDRLGFRQIGGDGVYLEMRWGPPDAASPLLPPAEV